MINRQRLAGIAAGLLALTIAVGCVKPQSQAPIVRVSRSVLDRYVGTYEFIPATYMLGDSTTRRQAPEP
jgi:hypothetical protein